MRLLSGSAPQRRHAATTTRSGSRPRSWWITSTSKCVALNKIVGEARAIVVTGGIERAIQYFHSFRDYLLERRSRYQAIVAFSVDHQYR